MRFLTLAIFVFAPACGDSTTIVDDNSTPAPCDSPVDQVTTTEALNHADCLLDQDGASDAMLLFVGSDQNTNVGPNGVGGWSFLFWSEERGLYYRIGVSPGGLSRSSGPPVDGDICDSGIPPFKSELVRAAVPATLPPDLADSDLVVSLRQSASCDTLFFVPTDGRVISTAFVVGGSDYYHSAFDGEGNVLATCSDPCESFSWSDCPCP